MLRHLTSRGGHRLSTGVLFTAPRSPDFVHLARRLARGDGPPGWAGRNSRVFGGDARQIDGTPEKVPWPGYLGPIQGGRGLLRRGCNPRRDRCPCRSARRGHRPRMRPSRRPLRPRRRPRPPPRGWRWSRKPGLACSPARRNGSDPRREIGAITSSERRCIEGSLLGSLHLAVLGRGQAAASAGVHCSGGAAATGIPSCPPSESAAASSAIIARMRSHSASTTANLPISSSVIPSLLSTTAPARRPP